MLAIIALVFSVLALGGLIFHALMADRTDGGIAHRRTALSQMLATRYPATFSPEAVSPTPEVTA